MMRGAAPVSAGASGELERLIAAITQRRRRARAARLRRRPRQDARGAARVRRRRRRARCRTISTSSAAGCSTASTSPGATRSSCPTRCCARSGRRSTAPAATRPRSTRSIADIRAQVPEEHRAEFDELLGEARLDVPPARRARRVQRHLGVGHHAPRRARGRPPARRPRAASHDAEHFVDAGFDEMCALVTGAGGPSADELAAALRRAQLAHAPRRRRRRSGRRRPRRPTRRASRPASARVMHAVGIAMGELFGSSEAPHEENLLRGLAASGGVYEGPARRVSGPVRVRPHRAGRRARHRVDDRGVQHPAAAARRDRHRQPAACSRTRRSSRVSTASPAWSARATRPTASPTARACASTATPAK